MPASRRLCSSISKISSPPPPSSITPDAHASGDLLSRPTPSPPPCYLSRSTSFSTPDQIFFPPPFVPTRERKITHPARSTPPPLLFHLALLLFRRRPTPPSPSSCMPTRSLPHAPHPSRPATSPPVHLLDPHRPFSPIAFVFLKKETAPRPSDADPRPTRFPRTKVIDLPPSRAVRKIHGTANAFFYFFSPKILGNFPDYFPYEFHE